MAKLVDAGHEWAAEIGRIVIAFGGIEHVTVLCLRSLPRDPIHKALANLKLAARIDLLLAILAGDDSPEAARLAQLFGKVKSLAVDRNHIVHNPLMLSVFDSDGELGYVEAIHSLSNANKRLSFAELVQVREQAEQLATNLYEAAAPLLGGPKA